MTFLTELDANDLMHIDFTTSEMMEWEFWQDKRYKWRWRAIGSPEREVIGSSSCGFTTRRECEINAAMFGCK